MPGCESGKKGKLFRSELGVGMSATHASITCALGSILGHGLRWLPDGRIGFGCVVESLVCVFLAG